MRRVGVGFEQPVFQLGGFGFELVQFLVQVFALGVDRLQKACQKWGGFRGCDNRLGLDPFLQGV